MKKILIVLILLIIVVMVVVPYTKVEILTLLHADKFQITGFEMVDDISYCKVMEYDDEKAEVLYVKTGEVTILAKYEKIGTEWVWQSWSCVWSSTGSADDFIWPFYR